MDILIKNMEMPQEGHIEAYIWCNGTVTYRKKIDNQWDRNSTTAVVLPEHGRLGDLDALKNSVADMRMEKPLRNGAKQVIEIGELFGRIIDDAPVIVEANNG